MMGELPQYRAYKGTGESWLGDVPEHWSLRRLKDLASIPMRNGVGEAAQAWHPDWPRYVRTTDILDRTTLRAGTLASLPPDLAAGALLEVGDVLFSAAGSIGKVYWHARDIGPACYAGFLVRLRPGPTVSPAFLSYWAQAPAFHDQVSMGAVESTIQNFSAGKYRRLEVALPPVAEQTAIVRFLDHADGRIRRYISAKRRLIILLNEQKQAVIRRALTRGLDANVRLAPSGAEWLGDVPSHWRLARSKRLFSPRKDLALPGDVQLSSTQAYGVISQSDFEARAGRRVVKISMHLEQRRHVERDDFVISMRSFQGGLERAWVSGAIRSSYVVLKPAAAVDVEFFSYVFKSPDYVHALQATADFIRDGQDLNFGNFSRVDLPLVPLDEQKAIAAFIATTTAGIDTTIARTEREITLIQEYRTRLTADVVSGNLDVREAALRLPEKADQPQRIDGADATAEVGVSRGDEDADAASFDGEA